MRRGDLVTHAGPGDYGRKPRPALVVQSDLLVQSDGVLICPLTSVLDVPPGLYRVPVTPSAENGLKERSFVMVDKIMAVRRTKCGKHVGRLESELMDEVDSALLFVIGLAD